MFNLKKIFGFICIILRGNTKAQLSYVWLAGIWDFVIDSANECEKTAWYNSSSSFFKQRTKLPGTMDDTGYETLVKINLEMGNHQINKKVLLHLWRKVSYTRAAWCRERLAYLSFRLHTFSHNQVAVIQGAISIAPSPADFL